jgi:pimeloyl-ACP methyl ester carboxylesterase
MTLAQRLEEFRASHPPRSVRTPAGEAWYTVGGTGARTVVVLHGGGSVAEAAHPFVIALERELHVVAIDWPMGATRVDDVIASIVAVLDAEHLQRVSLLGFSLGGMLAQCFVRACAERSEKLVLYVSMGPSAGYARRFARYRRALSLIPEWLLLRLSRRAVARWASAAVAGDPEAAAFIAGHRQWSFESGRVSKTSLLNDASILVDFFGRAFAPGEVSHPVLIVEAERDRMVHEVERAALRRLYPAARIITLPGTDHFAGVLAPSPIVEAIREFLTSASE